MRSLLPSRAVAVILWLLLVCSEGRAQRSLAVGIAIRADETTIDTLSLSNGSTVYSGELLQVGKGGHLLVRSGKLQLAVGPQSELRIFRSKDRTIVELHRGAIAYSADRLEQQFTIYAGDVRFSPTAPQPASGRIAFLPSCMLAARVSMGTLEVALAQETFQVRANHKYLIRAPVGVQYEQPSKMAGKELPEWSDPAFHQYHRHIACDEQPPPAGKLTPLAEAEIGAIPLLAVAAVIVALESPDSPGPH